ncbi:MAG: hypothetical protein ABL974_09045 [Prosthecobacter sp.]
MSNAATSHERIQDAEPKPSTGSGGWLADAAALFGQSAGADEEEPGALDALGDRQVAEQGLIRPWIERNALWIPDGSLNELLLGGTEHDVERVGDPVTHVRRVTKPTDQKAGTGYGFTPVAKGGLHLAPASLSAYLRRLLLLNEIFPEVSMILEGFIQTPQRIEVVTLQSYVPGRLLGDLASEIGKQEVKQLIERWFTRRRVVKNYLPDHVGPSHAWYRAEDNTALFDAKPANLIEWHGHLFPIDVNPARPTGELRRVIRAAL